MKMLFDAKDQRHVHIYLTYPVDEIDLTRKHEHERKGKRWNVSHHSLASFFRARQRSGDSFTLHKIQAGQTLKIELRDQLNF
jgi:hypothetical protein